MMKTGKIMLVALFLLVAVNQHAEACTTPPPTPPPVWITFHSDGSLWIVFHNYTTFGAGTSQFCACALNQVGSIASVNAVLITDAATGNPIPGWSFSANPVTSGGFGMVSPPENWTGFSSAVSQAIPAGVAVDIQFNVTLAPQMTSSDLLGDLQNASNVIATDEALSDGSPAGTHQGILPAGSISLANDPVPAVSNLGLAALILMVLAASVIVIRRSRRGDVVA